jgi:hypothetical protein
VTDGCGIDLRAIFLLPLVDLRAGDLDFRVFERDLAAKNLDFEISLLSLKYIIRPFFALFARNAIEFV